MAFSSASKILKPGGEKLDKFEEQLAEVQASGVCVCVCVCVRVCVCLIHVRNVGIHVEAK